VSDKAPRLCKMPLPGNACCPQVAVYAVTSKVSEHFIHRAVCIAHLVAAIDLDMKTSEGVRVRLVQEVLR
jgi:hypothetical protein